MGDSYNIVNPVLENFVESLNGIEDEIYLEIYELILRFHINLLNMIKCLIIINDKKNSFIQCFQDLLEKNKLYLAIGNDKIEADKYKFDILSQPYYLNLPIEHKKKMETTIDLLIYKYCPMFSSMAIEIGESFSKSKSLLAKLMYNILNKVPKFDLLQMVNLYMDYVEGFDKDDKDDDYDADNMII